MGSLSAMNSINRVLDTHGDDIKQEYRSQVPEAIQEQVEDIILSNNIHSITVEWKLKGGHILQGPEIDIDDLADQYPDCEVGY